MTQLHPASIPVKYEKGTKIAVLEGSLGYDNCSLLSATKMIQFNERETHGKIVLFRQDGLMALVDFDSMGKLWVPTHKLLFV